MDNLFMLSTAENQPYFTIDQRVRQDLILLFSVCDEFMSDIRELRKKHGLPEQGTGDKYTLIDNTNDKLVADLHAIRVKYNLSEAYSNDLHVLFVSEQAADTYTTNFLWHLRPFQIQDPDFPDEKLVAIKLYPETTLKDIVDYWEDIEEHRNMLYELRDGYKEKRQTKRKNLERDIFIHQLKQKGKKAVDIVKAVNSDTRFQNQKISYQDVSKILQRLKDEVDEIIYGKYEEGINESKDS